VTGDTGAECTVPLQLFAKPDEIAQVVVFLLLPSAAYVNGVVAPADGGWSLVQ
jgi:NAD(P)-dependent dehydrogenase (short-subunit alcohol dehydrogenase family)